MSIISFLDRFSFRHITIFYVVLSILVTLITMSRNDIGITPDSISYIEVAENISNGNGFVYDNGAVLTHWPPLYSLTLSVASDTLGLEVLASAKYLVAFLFGLFFVFFNLILKEIGISTKTQFFLNAFLFISPSLRPFLMLWSEPLFMVLLLMLAYLILVSLRTKSLVYLMFSGLIAGFLILTRYAGTGFIAGVVLFLLFNHDWRFLKRLKSIVLFSTGSIIFVGLWFVYLKNFNVSQISNREFAFHLTPLSKIGDFFETLSFWLFPFETLKSIILSLAVISLVIAFRKLRWLSVKRIYQQRKIRLLSYLILSYIAFLFLTSIFIDATVPFDNRLLAPIFPLLLIGIGVYVKDNLSSKILSKLSISMLIIIGLSQSYVFARSHYKFMRDGFGYSSNIWTTSEVLKALPEYNINTIYTNGNDVIDFFHDDINSTLKVLPKLTEASTATKNPHFSKEMKALQQEIASGKAILVYFKNVTWRFYYPEEKKVLEYVGETTVVRYADGFIIKASGETEE